MKAIIFFIFFILLAIPPVFGQIKIGDNPQNIDASSVLELESTSKVLVITRVTTAEMEAITPQRGGMVYNTDTECINYYDGTQWVNLCDAVDFSITNDPIINGRSTIEITESAAGYNLEVAKNSILGDNIIDGGIGPDDIQDNSITQDKLAAASVGSSEISENAVGSVEIRDGSIAPEDIANTVPDQLLTTDENGIVQWEDSNDFYDLTFNKLDTTLTLERSTIAGVSTISLGALIGSDDQRLDLTGNVLSIENDPNTYDLSTYLQQLSINPAGTEISLTNGGTITLPNPTIDTDEQNLGNATLANEILTINIENGDATTADLSPFATDAVVTAGLALKEDVANKSNDVTLGNSTNLYPTQNAVKTYVDNTVGGSAQTIVSEDPNNSISPSVNDGGAFYNDGDDDDQNELQDIVFNETTNILTISTPLTTGNEVDLSSLADAPELDDGFIFVGNAASEPTSVAVGGDVTMNNIGQFTIENNTIESNNILNNTITLADLNQNGAADGQVIKWDETLNAGLGAWTVATDNTGGTGGTVTSDGTTISGDGVNTALQVINESITSAKITDGTVAANDLALGAVNTDNILNGTILEIDIANNNVTPAKIEPAPGTLTEDQVLITNNITGNVEWADFPPGGGAGDDNQNATEVPYDPAASGLTATNTQAAIDELVNNGLMDTDDQNIDGSILTGDILTIGIEGGNNQDVSLTTFALDTEVVTAIAASDTADGDKSDTNEIQNITSTNGTVTVTPSATGNDFDLAVPGSSDDQNIDGSILTGDVLTIGIEGGNNQDVSLATFALDTEVATAIAASDTADGDKSDTNEIQNITSTNGTVTVTPSATGNDFDLAVPGISDDQNIDGSILTGDVLTIGIEGGNNQDVSLATFALDTEVATAITASDTADGDKSDTNEIQAITSTDGSVTITNTDNDFNLSVTSGQNITNANLNLDADRTVGLAGNDLYFTGGNIAIGGIPASPQSMLDVNGQIQTRSGLAANNGSAGQPSIGFYNDTDTGMFRGTLVDYLRFSTDGNEAMTIDPDQNVGIGVIAPEENLHVAGNIRTDGSFLSNDNLIGVPDYVFQKYFLGNSILNPSYSFKTLAEIEAFVKENNHLPGIQSAQAVKEQGFWNVSESSRVNLEKIEELFLHTIEQEKKIKELQKANTSMSSELEALKAQMQEIKNMVLEKQNN